MKLSKNKNLKKTTFTIGENIYCTSPRIKNSHTVARLKELRLNRSISKDTVNEKMLCTINNWRNENQIKNELLLQTQWGS